jgi:hypothetical protein
VKAFRAYLLRSLLAPVTAIRWRRYIRALHRDVGAAAPPTRVLAKPVRRYVHRAFWPRQRLALLLEHYRWLRALFSRELLARLCAGRRCPSSGSPAGHWGATWGIRAETRSGKNLGMIDETAIRLRYEALYLELNECGRRRFASAEALSSGHRPAARLRHSMPSSSRRR